MDGVCLRVSARDADTDEYREKERGEFTSHEGQWISRQGSL
jgi:hypothetical protein